MIVSGNLKTVETKGKLTVHISDKDFGNLAGNSLKQQRFSVQYNPESFSYSRSVDIKETSQENAAPKVEFNITNKRKVTLNLTFDAATGQVQNVKQLTQPFELLTQPLVKKPNDTKGRPPYIVITWADESLRGFVKSFSQQFTLFDGAGIPKRSKVVLEFVEYVEPDQQKKEEGSGDPEHYYYVQANESLQMIAYKVFRDPTLWKKIADYNDLTRLRDIKAGTKLMLPAIN